MQKTARRPATTAKLAVAAPPLRATQPGEGLKRRSEISDRAHRRAPTVRTNERLHLKGGGETGHGGRRASSKYAEGVALVPRLAIVKSVSAQR